MLNIILTTRNIDSGFLAGHEFRQAQTGLSINFIQKDQDYSLAYPTPLFGPPWSIPMEFPLYQWAAASLGTHFEMTTVQSGRTVSIICFYLCLPAIVLLLRGCRFQADQINYVLALVLTAPVFIYYSRAILIESMALCLSLWFLYGFMRLSKTGHWSWCLFTMMFGSLAALVKVTTFMVWGMGALIGGIWWFVKIRRAEGMRQANRNLIGAACSAMPPVVAGIWWVSFTDKIKQHSPDGQFLTSENLRDFNLGSWSDRLDSNVWGPLTHNLSLALFPFWLFALLGIGGLVLAGIRRSPMTLILIGWSTSVWLTFPGLYQIHDYYFYAMALLPLLAIGFVLRDAGLKTIAQVVGPILILLAIGTQLQGYFTNYAPTQSVVSRGGSSMEIFIDETFPVDATVLVLGQDWSPIIAYHTQRRGLMIRDTVARNPQKLEVLLDKWDDVPVSGLLVAGSYRTDLEILSSLAARFGLETPVLLTDGQSDLRVGSKLRYRLISHIARHPHNHPNLKRPEGSEIHTPPATNTDPIIADGNKYAVTANQAASVFFQVHPSPSHYRTKLGIGTAFGPDGFIMVSHPGGEFWVDVADTATEVIAEFGLQDEVYQDPHDHSDGVSFQIWAIGADGEESQLFERYADPFNAHGDRGKLSVSIPLPIPQPSQIRFSTHPGANDAYDWAYWGNVIVQ